MYIVGHMYDFTTILVGWPSGLRRYVQVVVFSKARVRIPLQSKCSFSFFFFVSSCTSCPFMFICTYYIVLYMYALYVRNMYHVFFSPSSFFIVSIFYILSCHVLVLRLTLLRITCLKVYRGTPYNTAAASMVQRKRYRQLSRVDIRRHTMQLQ
jgi:hypothetical protein